MRKNKVGFILGKYKIKIAMEQVYPLKVPLVVDVKVGDNWGEV
ncbi:MAG: hypothetical protein WC823_03130 [Parcubacteria group bacterium]